MASLADRLGLAGSLLFIRPHWFSTFLLGKVTMVRLLESTKLHSLGL